MTNSFNDLDLRKHRSLEDIPPADVNAVERLTRQKDEIADKVANAAEEIERLRMRQEELEYARKALQELNRKQDAYTQEKKELIANFSKRILEMEKEEIRASRLLEMLSATRQQFKEMLCEIREIHEEQWEEPAFEEELDRSLALLENARMVYNKSMAKMEAQASWRGSERSLSGALMTNEVGRHPLAGKGFGFWFKVGIALALPLLVGLSVIAALFFWFGGWF